jgi:uncharacterized membrane protein YphA (DoxX/SURF4 family)
MKSNKAYLFVILRILIGWHFLYEGITKLIDPQWSSEAYLKGSYGFMSSLFQFLASDSRILAVVDLLNEWGLFLIGSALILGIFIRMACLSGMVLLLLYYFAYPPFGQQISVVASEGNFWIVNRNLIEIVVLLIIYFVPTTEFSIGMMIKHVRNNYTKKVSNQTLGDDDALKRRELLRGLAAFPIFGGIIGAGLLRNNVNDPDALSGATIALKRYNLKDLKGSLPKGMLGDLEASRLILGCNLFGGGAHSRDLDYVHDLARRYNTTKKIFETLALGEQAGIYTTNMVSRHFPLFNEYKRITGSQMKTVSQLHLKAGSKDTFRELRELVGFGTDTMYIQGANADTLVKNGRLDLIEEALEKIREQGMSAGVGAHSIEVLIACERAGIKPDYYYKTFHHDNYWSAHPKEYREEFSVDGKRSTDHNKLHDNMFDLFPDKTIRVIKDIEVPVVGFKVLAAGAILPEDGFRYAFENGADFICVGMFDWQVIENVNTVVSILGDNLNRNRKWFA